MEDFFNRLRSSLKTVNVLENSETLTEVPFVLNKLTSTFFLQYYWPYNRCIRFQQHRVLKSPYRFKSININIYIHILGLCSLLSEYSLYKDRYNVFNYNNNIIIIDTIDVHLTECFLFMLHNELQQFTLIDIFTLKEKTYNTVPEYVKFIFNEQKKINMDSLTPMTHFLVDTQYCKYCCYTC